MVCPAPAGLPCLSLSTASDLLNQKKKLKGVEDRNSSCRSLVAPIYSHACGSRFRARASPDDDGDVLAAALAARSRLRLWLSITMRGRHHAPLELVRRRRLGSLDLAGFSSSRGGGSPATPAGGAGAGPDSRTSTVRRAGCDSLRVCVCCAGLRTSHFTAK